jgi:hypothetical protein
MAPMTFLCSRRMGQIRIIDPMLRTDQAHTRTLTLVLPESEWRALRDAEPDAIGWLQLQIRHRLTTFGDRRGPTPLPVEEDDDY